MLTPEVNGGVTTWSASFPHQFTHQSDGGEPYAPLSIDGNSDLFGTTQSGGSTNLGTVFEITFSSGQYACTTLHSFGDNATPNVGGLRRDLRGR